MSFHVVSCRFRHPATPFAAQRPCTYPGCPALTTRGRCDAHRAVAKAARRESDARRGSARSRGYDSRWEKARTHYLRAHPLCVRCEQRGRATAATAVDHIIPHRGDRARFWDSGNWQPLCKPCHDAKTAREDGGYGNARG